jgi:hypothetical protein
MKQIAWQDGLQDMVTKLCAIFPPVIKSRWESRLRLNAEKIAAYEEAPFVNDDIFWRAAYEVFPGGYEPLILSVKDPGRMRAEVAASKAQEDLDPGAEPVVITRWAKDCRRSRASFSGHENTCRKFEHAQGGQHRCHHRRGAARLQRARMHG